MAYVSPLPGVLLIALSAPLAGSAFAAGQPAKVTFNMREYAFDATTDTVKAGTVTITGRNTGRAPHNLVFQTINKRSAYIQPGALFKLVLNFKPGSYTYICTIGRHASYGMHGVLVVN